MRTSPRGLPKAALWPHIGGPLLVLGAAAAIELLSRGPFRIPNPPAVLLLIVVFSAFIGGVGSGLKGVARELGCSEREIEDIRWGARLHDIGKIGVPDAVLGKPRALSEREWIVMRQHPVLGAEILSPVERMRGVAKLVRHHQEKWDGTGYPDGLKAEAIPVGSRILAVVDAYGAIMEARPYKPARTHAEAVAEIRRCAGSQFDPEVARVFCSVVETLRREPAK